MAGVIEIRLAWEWTCEECGRDQFERAPIIAIEQMKPGMVLSAVDEEASQNDSWHVRPNYVICNHCESEFEVGSEV